MPNIYLQLKVLSSLAKVFADQTPDDQELQKGTMLINEAYSFQVAYKWNSDMKKNVKIHIQSEITPWINVSSIGLVPSEMPCYAGHDDNVLRTLPGLYPDLLLPLDEEGITLLPEQWRSIWFTVNPGGKAKAGTYPIEIAFISPDGEVLDKTIFYIEILAAELPEQKLIHTEWFHSDCIATYYGLQIFSEEHWMRIGQFLETAVKHGINMILVPLFTPPLDTAVGGERPTVQLVDVDKQNIGYRFGFDRLKRWINLCREKGVKYFEFSHFFTQWGAKHAPKIMAWENGEYKRIFGWETDAGGEDYHLFLSQFLRELKTFIEQNNLVNCSYFHVSDEPRTEHMEDYSRASKIIHEQLKEYPVIDALSDYSFYEKGIVKNPIPASNHIQKFLDANVPDLWTYYCCSQYKLVANRFFNMPSARNRILGMQLYKFKIKGFLHWGYNFWYSQCSRYPIDPFRVTDAGYAFPSGDAFLVYPGKEGPLESLRLKVMYEALQDLRALELLEKLTDRDTVLNMLEEGLEHPITFDIYPKEAEWLLRKREQINRIINGLTEGQGCAL